MGQQQASQGTPFGAVGSSGPHRWLASLATILLLTAACSPARGAQPTGSAGGSPNPQAVADFYRGKTISIVVGVAAGGGTDTTARLVSRHLGSHIPGEPNVIVENMEGAGSLLSVNHVYNVARPDGLTIGTFLEAQIINQATGGEGIEFDARKFGWLGSANRNTQVCTIRSDSVYSKPQDLLRKDLPPLIVGATGPGTDTHDVPKIMSAVLGTNVRVVAGYGGSSQVRLAVESREVDGMCWTWESLISTAQNWVDTSYIRIIAYQSPEIDPRVTSKFPDAARLEDLTTDPQGKQIIRAGTAAAAIAKPYVVPPGVPPERLKALQDAFAETMKDPAFLAEAEQIRLDVNPNSAAEVERVVNEILNLPPDLARRLAEARK